MAKVNISTEDFDRVLADVIDSDNAKASDLLTIPGIYEVLSEHYNNEVLAEYETEQENSVEETEE